MLSDNNYIESLAKYIKNSISKYSLPFMGVVFTLQNETIINRNIKIIKPQDKQDIPDLIKYELKKFMTIDLDNYIIRYVINDTFDDELELQAILFPKSSIEICKQIASILKIKPRKICVNFNVIQNLIHKNIINIENEQNLIIEIKQNIVNLNVVKNKYIIESYSLSKNIDLIKYIKSKSNNIKKAYVYGINDKNIIEQINNIVKVEDLKINNINIKNENKYNLEEFINNIGLTY